MKVQLRTGHSGKGLSYYSRKRACLRRSQLDELADKERIAAGLPEYKGGGSSASLLGTMMHGILEAYTRSGGCDPGALVFEPADHAAVSYMLIDKITKEPVIEVARKLFAWWQIEYPPDLLGTRIGAELTLPQTPEGAARIKERFGHEVTGDMDLVTRLDQAQADRLCLMFGGDFHPGLWGWDYKVLADISSAADYANSGQQHVLYPELFRLETGKRLDGFGYVIIARGRKRIPEPEMKIMVMEPNQAPQIEGLVRRIDNTERVANLLTDQNPALTDFNLDACTNRYGDKCPHWASGRCKRV